MALPDKPSIAVLPFQNMSGDATQEYFADGMVEDIITALSRFRNLFVERTRIAEIDDRHTAKYGGAAVSIRGSWEGRSSWQTIRSERAAYGVTANVTGGG